MVVARIARLMPGKAPDPVPTRVVPERPSLPNPDLEMDAEAALSVLPDYPPKSQGPSPDQPMKCKPMGPAEPV